MITAIQEFESDIKSLLKKSGVSAFSYMDVTGYKAVTDEDMNSNWFASNIGEYMSVLFYAFVQDELVDEVISAIDDLNELQESGSRIHVAVTAIKRTNKIEN